MNQRKQIALDALIKTRTRAEAAKLAGISERTLRAYFNDEEFSAEYLRRFNTLTAEATESLKRSARIAVEALAEIVADPEVNAAVRVGAAGRILENVPKFSEMFEINYILEKLTGQKTGQEERTIVW